MAPRTDTRIIFFHKDWIVYSKHDNHSKLNIEHNWRGGGVLYDYSMIMSFFTLVLNKIFI